jgi:hypothetical protein
VLEEYREAVEQLILREGPQGVNALSRELNVPLSTMQKYMKTQRYFIQNEQRRWDIPANIAQLEIAKTQGNLNTVIDTQLAGIDSLFELLSSSIRSTVTLLKSQKAAPAAAKVDSSLPPVVAKFCADTKEQERLTREHLKKIPEEYRPLLLNLDTYQMFLTEGTKHVKKGFLNELSELILGERTELSTEIVELLEQYQKDMSDLP